MRAVVLVLAALGGCVFPIGIPSARVDGGYTIDHRPTLRAGSHVAGYRLDKDARWDVGGGYTITGASNDPMETTASTSGGYLEAALLRRIESSTRVSLGPGVTLQVPHGTSDAEPGVYLRGGVELFGSGMSSGTSTGRCGAVTGTWFGQTGFGSYVEVAKPLTHDGFAVTIGVSIRLPAFAGIGVGIPYCK